MFLAKLKKRKRKKAQVKRKIAGMNTSCKNDVKLHIVYTNVKILTKFFFVNLFIKINKIE